MDTPLSREEVIAKMKELATPIDFADLATGIETHLDRGDPVLKLPKSWTQAQKLYRRYTGKEYDESFGSRGGSSPEAG
jgi:hypothetical protein